MIAPLALALLAGCGRHVFPTATIQVDGHPVLVEIASDSEQRARGLMHRDSLPADEGMLFIYPDETPRSFWMKNTRIALDIAFADRTGKIVRIATMRPLVTESTPSLYPATYALEMNAGWFADHGVATGALITDLPAVIPEE